MLVEILVLLVILMAPLNDTTTGALTVDGGVGIVKNLNVGGDFDVDGNATIGDANF